MADQPQTTETQQDAIVIPSWWTALIGFLTALPQIMTAITSVMTWLNKITGNNPGAIISKIGSAFDALNTAQTDADKTAAAKGLADVIANLPSA